MMIRRSLGVLLWALAGFATALLALALILRLIIQDRLIGFSLVYYASPWPIIAGGAAVCAFYWERIGQRFTAALLVVECLVGTAGWLMNDWQWRRPIAERGDLRMVQWNVDRPNLRLDGTLRWLVAQDADLITIAERQPHKIDTMPRWRAAFPGYHLVSAHGETLCLVRGEVRSIKKEMRSEGSYATAIRVRIRGHDLTVLQVDICGNPTGSRAGSLGKLAAIVHRLHGENLILAGDFNTPVGSTFLKPIRREMTNAFEATGSGCIATWPMPFPVLSLDHIWTCSRLRPVRCEHFVSRQSDHRAVAAEINFVR